VRTCVIFNPAARGEKAKRFRRFLDEIGTQSTLKLTAAPDDARRLAAEAVQEGSEVVVAAGGDGTINEVLNGLGDVKDGFERACLGVLPLGTVNVFARELAIPLKVEPAWRVIRAGKETRIDLPKVEYTRNHTTTSSTPLSSTIGKAPTGRPESNPRTSRYFVQLAGAGLDARAVELVQWELKKKLGPLAYVVAGLKAMCDSPAIITAADGENSSVGGLVLIGNGRFYGGEFRVFPKADLRDGLLDVRVFPRVNWLTLARCGPPLLLGGSLPASTAEAFRVKTLRLTSPAPTPLEVDGELIGHLPATFSVEQARLRVVVPSL
jgi:YegS/Rv2252/BmrU family lipid kinase